ncbi:MAG: hypothetical protein LC130_16395 [Bryobacterales bacterium]|nr:hypothetical protein [Bryobacterales bacterium]
MIYKFRSGASSFRGLKNPAQVGKALERIRKQNEGQLKPGDVVEAARPENSVLHPGFTWDDTEAAEEYRKWEARELVRQIVVVHPETDEEAPAFIHVSVAGDEGGKNRYYQSSAVLVDRPDEYQSALECAMRKLKEASRAFEDIKRLCSDRDDRMALLAVAMEALSTVQVTVQRLQ